jgi:hypothetical protein
MTDTFRFRPTAVEDAFIVMRDGLDDESYFHPALDVLEATIRVLSARVRELELEVQHLECKPTSFEEFCLLLAMTAGRLEG